jgi:hypothetical protein
VNSFSDNEFSTHKIDKAIALLDGAEEKGFTPIDELFYAKASFYSQKSDHKNALDYYRKAAEKGNIDGMFMSASYCIDGKAGKADYQEALKWYIKAAEQGNADAMFMAGILYNEKPQINYKKAFEWFKKAAENDNITAKKYLGDCYAEGKGTAKNAKEAMKWYASASDDGCKESQSAMCLLLFKENKPRELMRYAEMLTENRDSEKVDLIKADAFKAHASLLLKDYKKLLEIGRHYKLITTAAILVIALLLVTPISIFIFTYLFIIWLRTKPKTPAVHPLCLLDSFSAFGLFVVIGFAGAILTCPVALFFNYGIVFLLGVAVVTGALNVIFWMLVIKLRQNSIISGLSLHSPQTRPLKAFVYVLVTYVLVVMFAEGYELCLNYFGIKIDVQDITRMMCDAIRNSNSSLEIIVMVLCVVLFMPIIEEIIFRGVIYNGARSVFSGWGAGLFSSVMFAAVHFDILYLLPLFAMGLALCYLREKTKSLYLPIVLHSLNNLISVIVCFFFPYPL